jgi:hypothetical protein
MEMSEMSTKLKLATVIQRLVDELGEVQEQRKQYEVREDALKDQLYKYGPGVYMGRMYDAQTLAGIRSSYKTARLEEIVPVALLEKCVVKTPYLKTTLTKKAKLRVVK